MSIIDQAYESNAHFRRAVKKAVVKTPRSAAEIADRLGLAEWSESGNLIVPKDVGQRLRRQLYELAEEGVVAYEGNTVARVYYKN